VERPQTLADGAIVFDAALNVRDLDAQYNITLPEDPAYATVGGFVLDQLGFIPRGGENFEYDGYRFTVVEMDGRRVARVKIERILPITGKSKSESAGASASDAAGSASAATASAQPSEVLKTHPDPAARTR
jgi:putative hemolysin